MSSLPRLGIAKGLEQKVVGFRNSSGELEKPRGERNTLKFAA